MHSARRSTWFFACLSHFTASMLTLVVADNTIQLLVGWELVGLCSFMLIGHWWEDRANVKAAIKAFLTTRTGDIGLMIGVIILFFTVGSFGINQSNLYALSGHPRPHLLLPPSLLLLLRTIGNGGVNFMAVIGGITILIGAALAFVQRDIKKVLAYSTISQLGYMVMGLGVGAWTAAVFHLFTHAFFKALLFLGAGSVSHGGTHHSFDMKTDMGGLKKYMPQTFWTFAIGTLALAGIV